MNSDTFYVSISGKRGKGCKCVNFVSSWSFCTKRFGETSGADLGGHWRSQLTKTSDPGGVKIIISGLKLVRFQFFWFPRPLS